MNPTNLKLHDFQLMILNKLASKLEARFNELLIEGLESEHVNYHLQKLIDFKLVEKSTGKYKLTDAGKDYSNLIDSEAEILEKGPKVSVLLHIVRRNKKTNEVEHLLSRRLRQPYFGKIGRLTGKVKFGETIETAARRELFEETGLEANDITLENIYHKLRYRENGEYVQDGIFFRFFIKNPSGDLIEKTPNQENIWISTKDLNENKNFDLFDGLELTDRFEAERLSFTESDDVAIGY